MQLTQIVSSAASLAIVLAIVAIFWTIMWKFVFEPNPLIRDFFDLDQAERLKNKNKPE